MAEKIYNKEFLEYIHARAWDGVATFGSELKMLEPGEYFVVSNLTLADIEIERAKINHVFFDSCIFERVIFNDVDFSDGILEDCKFIDCKLKPTTLANTYVSATRFVNTELFHILFSETIFVLTTFYNCNFLDITFANSTFANTVVDRGLIAHSTFEHFIVNDPSITFIDTQITHSVFYHANLEFTLFNGVTFSDVSFIDNQFGIETFKKVDIKSNYDSCYVDMQTVLKNDIDENTFRLFGIQNFFAKDYIKDLVTEIQFQSVFISYSFEDRDFAHIINEQLRRHGVNTFLWERDAPGGKRLKKIMSENIRKHDRLLFIASQHSLQSEACQYELKEAREKQTSEWKDIYYPIHIDDYLFEVRKGDIPRKHREDFWENIEEVKEFHSKDFTKYRVAGSYDMKEFDEEVKKVIKDLKL